MWAAAPSAALPTEPKKEVTSAPAEGVGGSSAPLSSAGGAVPLAEEAAPSVGGCVPSARSVPTAGSVPSARSVPSLGGEVALAGGDWVPVAGGSAGAGTEVGTVEEEASVDDDLGKKSIGPIGP